MERSWDGQSFVPVTSVDAKKRNSTGASYKALDNDPYNGMNYYRLKIVRDYGLNPLYSQTISIKAKSTSTATARIDAADGTTSLAKGLYPNPSRGNFSVDYSATQAGAVQITMVNTMGQVMHTQETRCQKGTNQTNVRAAGLPKGVYFILLHTPDQTIKEKVIIQ